MAARTETEMLSLLRRRYTEKAGNGDAWAFITHVRNAAGFDASRTADAIAMALWPSRGLVLNGFEVKCSRSDWLRELKKPAKAEQFGQLVDFWWLAVADDTIVQLGEVPERWGLLVAKGSRLVCKIEAKALHDLTPASRHEAKLPASFGRSFLASLLRAACRTGEAGPAEIREAVDLALEGERRGWVVERDRWHRERDATRAFAEATGLPFGEWTLRHADEAARIGRAIRLVLDGDDGVQRLEERLRRVRDQAAAVVSAIDEQLAASKEAAA